VVFALLLVPNSALAWLFLKHKLTAASCSARRRDGRRRCCS
jgi:hypothetical protein